MTEQTSANAARKTERREAEHLFTERNRFFTGKYMTARDFLAEQTYFRSHHSWHQWTLHGWGIVWGLEVSKLPYDQCLTIAPGMALDCHGRELVLPYPVTVPVSEIEKVKDEDLLIGLRYDSFERDPVPLLLDDRSECQTPAKNTHNRIDEFARIGFERYCEACWSFPRPWQPADLPKPVPYPSRPDGPYGSSVESISLYDHNHRDDCHNSLPPVQFKPPCECKLCGRHGFVPLARLSKKGSEWNSNDLGRRYVPSPFYREALTHIVGINWRHGQRTHFDELKNAYSPPADTNAAHLSAKVHAQCHGHLGRIMITFDRNLGIPKGLDSHAHGHISNYLAQLIKLEYVVLDGYEEFDLDGDDPPLSLTPKDVTIHENQLYCDFPLNKVHRELPVRIRLSLNCDMLMDERGRAVDGDHIGGYVPFFKGRETPPKGNRSGNGTEGGVFSSWTMIIPEHKHKDSYTGTRLDQAEGID